MSAVAASAAGGRGVFVTGTDTGAGKTLVSAALLHGLTARALRAAGMKPVATGCERTPAGLRNADALCLARHAGVAAGYEEMNPYAFEPAIAPHLAASEAGVRIDLARIAAASTQLARRADRIVVEGIGGWRVPLNEREDVADLARAIALPVLLVVGVRLGCLNHARLSADSIAASGVHWAGWVASCIDSQMSRIDENLAALERLLPAPHLGTIPFLADASVDRAATELERALRLLA
jgi:dethiobiotin synthetase